MADVLSDETRAVIRQIAAYILSDRYAGSDLPALGTARLGVSRSGRSIAFKYKISECASVELAFATEAEALEFCRKRGLRVAS